METAHDLEQLDRVLAPSRRSGEPIAFVPTLGNLHEGHMALVERARQVGDQVVASVFVNPTQFAPGEDFAEYPRTLEADRQRLRAAGVDVLFAPGESQVYPDGPDAVTVSVDRATEGLESTVRPHFFTGVATVVTKLLCAVRPDRVVLGKKDYQQWVVVRRLVRNLLLNVAVEAVETVRETDGLAVSSRNQYLSPAERQAAPGLFQGMRSAVEEAFGSGLGPEELADLARERIAAAGLRPEYVAVRRGGDLEPVTDLNGERVVLAAAYLGTTRLIDNLEFGPRPKGLGG